jgi:hypothetical protein
MKASEVSFKVPYESMLAKENLVLIIQLYTPALIYTCSCIVPVLQGSNCQPNE